MKKNPSLLVFLIVEIAVVVFILTTVGALPAHLATHFNGSGMPNRFMPKIVYVIFILLFATGFPAGVVGLISWKLRSAPDTFNFPNHKFWLSPENQQETIRFLEAHTPWLGLLHGLFLGYVHWAIVTANSVQPAHLSSRGIVVGTSLFLAGIFLWLVVIVVKFGRLPKV